MLRNLFSSIGIRQCPSVQRERNHSNNNSLGMLVKRKMVTTLKLKCCKKEDDKLVKVTREVQPYFQAHRNSTIVLCLSAEIIDSPYLSSALKVKLLSVSDFTKMMNSKHIRIRIKKER